MIQVVIINRWDGRSWLIVADGPEEQLIVPYLRYKTDFPKKVWILRPRLGKTQPRVVLASQLAHKYHRKWELPLV